MKPWIRNAFIGAAVVLCVVSTVVMENSHLARDPQLKVLREMMPYWDRTESGGIVLLGAPPQEQALASYRQLTFLPADGTADSKMTEKWEAALPGMIDKLQRFFQNAHLEPGTYTFQNSYYPLLKRGLFKGDSTPLNSDGEQPVITIPQTETVTFTVTADHLKLLRHMNMRSYGPNIELMDPKRPYGDMTYYFIDMAAALGHPLARDQHGTPKLSAKEIADYHRLHGEMLWAVAAFLRYAKL